MNKTLSWRRLQRHGGQHLNGGTPLRKNFANIGGNYDQVNDAFYNNQPFPSWTLNNSTFLWNPPIPRPTDDKAYYWDESAYQADNTKGWVEIG